MSDSSRIIMQSESTGTASACAEPPRPHVIEKDTYVPHAGPEEFIVPVLRKRIEECLQKYGKPASSASKMLDVGCGRQPFRGFIEGLGFAYQSCDVNQSPENTVDYVFAIDAPMPREVIDAAPFELLFCTEVLEHVADWDAAFGHMASLLSEGGVLIITAPHFYQLHEVPYDFWRPTLHAIEFFARRHGFSMVHTEAAGDGWDVLGTLLANITLSPNSRSLLDRVAARVARAIQYALFCSLVNRSIQKRIRMGGPLYISNIAVCRKEAAL